MIESNHTCDDCGRESSDIQCFCDDDLQKRLVEAKDQGYHDGYNDGYSEGKAND